MIIERVKHLWRRLTEPSDAIRQPARRHNARLMASLLVVFIPLGIAITALPALLDPSLSVWQDEDFVSMVAGFVFWGAAYALSRSGRYELAIQLAAWAGSIATYATVNEFNPWETVFLIIPVLFSSLLLSVRATVLLGIVDLVAVLLLPVLYETLTLTDVITGPLSFLFIGTALVLWSARHRDQLERDRQVELAHSEARYRDLFETTFEGIAIHEGGVLVDVNPGLAQMFGYSLSEMVGMSLLDLVTEGSQDTVAQRVKADVIDHAQPCQAWGLRKNGTAFRMELLAKGQTWHERAVQVVAIRDITERVRTEEALRRSVAELENLQQITETLLGLGELSQVVNAVARGIVDNLGFDVVLVSRYVEEKGAFTGLALYPMPMPQQLDWLLRFLEHPELRDAPMQFNLPYRTGQNALLDRVLAGESVMSDSLADFFAPWAPRSAAMVVQKLFGIQAYIDLPMRVKGQTVGTIMAGVREAAISIDQQKALARVADQAAVALENARLYEAERQRSVELGRSNAFITALGQVAARIETTHDPKQVMAALGSELKRLGLNCFIILQEPDAQEFFVRYISVEPSLLAKAEDLAGARMESYRVRRVKGPFTEAIEHGRPVFVPDLTSLADVVLADVPRSAFQRILPLVGITPDTPMIYLPLTAEERVAGVLAVWGTELREADVPAFSAFANQVAVALENARLYEQAQQEIAERVQVEQALRESEEKFRSVIEQSADGIVLLDDQGRVVEWNQSLEQISGLEQAAVLGRPLWDVLASAIPVEHDVAATHQRATAGIRQLLGTGQSSWPNGTREIAIQRPDGTRRSVQLTVFPIETSKGRAFGGVLRDVTERVQDEAKIKASLKEKEVLLQEIHHRVKNNMQVISSLLNLQSGYVEDPQALEVFRESQHRVRSMALIHEKLYQSENLAQIDFGEYMHSLVTSLSRSYGTGAEDITLDIRADDVSLGIDTAVPCGLILNELVSNALKHAFPDSRGGEIRIELQVDHDCQLLLRVSDDGVGFPEDLDWRTTTSLGLQLVHTLVGQLEGSVEMHSNGGTEFQIRFYLAQKQ